jgi:fructose-bisphosphate aldolase class I
MSNNLHKIAQKLVAPGKGILAADESNSTAGDRLADCGLENTPENRRRYRNLLLNTEGIGQYLSGVILFTETLDQKSDDGVLFPQLLQNKDVIPGVKVDLGKVEFNGFPGEKITEGIDGLSKRLQKYKSSGAQFTKWRAVFNIGSDTPTPECIHTNAINLARYARIAQDEGYVPIIEPEVLHEGEHGIEDCEEATARVLSEVSYQLDRYRVDCEAAIIKTNMILPGKSSNQDISDEEIATQTVDVLRENLPENIAGVVFLSGGQKAKPATEHLNAIAKKEPLPFEITFSYGRAIQRPALRVWEGKEENLDLARKKLIDRLRANTQADLGQLQD